MSDKPTKNDALRALAQSGSADPTLAARMTEKLAPPPDPQPTDGVRFTAAVRRLVGPASSFADALRRRREASPTIRTTSQPSSSDLENRSSWVQDATRRIR